MLPRASSPRAASPPFPAATGRRSPSLSNERERERRATSGTLPPQVLTDQNVVDIAAKTFGDPTDAAKKIVREAFAKQAADNVTALVLEFPWVDAAKVKSVWAASEKQLHKVTVAAKNDEPFDMFA